jgi:hypothetical protein
MERFYSFDAKSFSGDGLCHNSEPGTYNHECGKPAAFIGTDNNAFRMGFCEECAATGFERHGLRFERIKSREVVGERAYVFIAN